MTADTALGTHWIAGLDLIVRVSHTSIQNSPDM